ncbi:MAG: hypothetical protein EA368_19630, partial [Leptolyngbya sp. DLM2.Bin27]
MAAALTNLSLGSPIGALFMPDKHSLRNKYSRILQGALRRDEVEHGDEPMCNHSSNSTFADVLNRRLQRRSMLKGSLALAVTS